MIGGVFFLFALLRSLVSKLLIFAGRDGFFILVLGVSTCFGSIFLLGYSRAHLYTIRTVHPAK